MRASAARALCAAVALASSGVLCVVAGTAAMADIVGGEQLGLSGRQANLGPGADPVPEIWAETWILADATTGEVLAAKDAHKQRPPASTLKTLTAVTLLPRLPLDQAYTVTWKDSRAEGSRVGLVDGKAYSIEQLFYGMFLRSGNDTAEALARANGSVTQTVSQMNDMAQQLQAYDTVAKTPSGLDRPGQVSSAYDLALIARAGLRIPAFATFCSTKSYDFPGRGSSTYTIYNQNRLMMGGYKGAIGVKTGFTTNAGRTLIAAATRKGTTLIFVGMGIHEASADAAAKALTWGFKNRDQLSPVGVLVEPVTATPSPDPSASATALSAAQQAQLQADSDRQLAQAGLIVPIGMAGPSAGLAGFAVLLLSIPVIVLLRIRSRRRASR
ncbi:MAG: serine hydrolase [Actinomycetales bacterium]|nr:serine hydrolase [Actinomycetales bacterium]